MKYIMLFEEFSKIYEAYSEKLKDSLVAKFRAEKPTLAKQTILAYINKFEKSKESLRIIQKDITKYRWDEFERVLDSLPISSRIKAGKIAVDGGDEIYSKDGLRVYTGENKRMCIKYGNGYNWCISARGDENMYNRYRLDEGGTPYFVFDSNRSSEKKSNGFVEPLHAAVVFVFKNFEGEIYKYSFSNANNVGDDDFDTIKEMIEDYPYLKPIAHLFKSIELTDPEDIKNVAESEICFSFDRILGDAGVFDKIKKDTGVQYQQINIGPTSIEDFKIAATGKTTAYYVYHPNSTFCRMLFVEGNPDDKTFKKILTDIDIKLFIEWAKHDHDDPNTQLQATGKMKSTKYSKIETSVSKNLYDKMQSWYVEAKKSSGGKDPIKIYADHQEPVDDF